MTGFKERRPWRPGSGSAAVSRAGGAPDSAGKTADRAKDVHATAEEVYSTARNQISHDTKQIFAAGRDFSAGCGQNLTGRRARLSLARPSACGGRLRLSGEMLTFVRRTRERCAVLYPSISLLSASAGGAASPTPSFAASAATSRLAMSARALPTRRCARRPWAWPRSGLPDSIPHWGQTASRNRRPTRPTARQPHKPSSQDRRDTAWHCLPPRQPTLHPVVSAPGKPASRTTPHPILCIYLRKDGTPPTGRVPPFCLIFILP